MRLEPLLSRLSVIDKRGMQVPFRLNWAQRIYLESFEERWNAGRPVRIIILKARQLGMSTLTEAIIFLMALHIQNMRGMVVGNEVENAQHLLSMTDNFWETYPFKPLYTTEYNSKNELAWKDTNSSIKVATAKNAKAGRGKTIRALHGSEVAFWENARTTMLGLTQAIPYLPDTFIGMESTACGVGGYFYEQWNAAEEGETDYVPLFFPWFKHPEYMASHIGLPYHNLGKLDEEEKTLRNVGVSDDRLAWRRWAIRNLAGNDINGFHQEYPTTPEEAFIATGTNVFPVEHLRQSYEPMEGMRGRLVWDNGRTNNVRFQEDATGPLTIFSYPSEDTDFGMYFIGGDPTHTTIGDYACAQVLNRRTLEQVAVFRQKVDAGNFGVQLDLLGRYYNKAIIAPEFEGPGAATVATLIANNYPHIWDNKVPDTTPGKYSDHKGWRTTAKSKDFAIGWLLKLIVDHDVTLHDRQTFIEMKEYVTLESGGYGNGDGTENDDTVMALAMCVAANQLEGVLLPYGNPEAQEVPWETWDQMREGA